MTHTCTVETPLGAMTAAAENEALIGLWFIGQKYYPGEMRVEPLPRTTFNKVTA